jgi:hypothetical protein
VELGYKRCAGGPTNAEVESGLGAVLAAAPSSVTRGKLTQRLFALPRILTEAQRMPDREADGTATWSLLTLRQALCNASDGLPQLSTATIRTVLREQGWSWQRTRSWCDTGKAVRRRKSGPVEVIDVDAAAKKP